MVSTSASKVCPISWVGAGVMVMAGSEGGAISINVGEEGDEQLEKSSTRIRRFGRKT